MGNKKRETNKYGRFLPKFQNASLPKFSKIWDIAWPILFGVMVLGGCGYYWYKEANKPPKPPIVYVWNEELDAPENKTTTILADDSIYVVTIHVDSVYKPNVRTYHEEHDDDR